MVPFKNRFRITITRYKITYNHAFLFFIIIVHFCVYADIIVPDDLKPPSIDILWTTNLSMDQLAEVLRECGNKWDDPCLIDLLD